MIKQCNYMGKIRLGSDVPEKQDRIKIGPASKRGKQRITDQPPVLPPANLNYPVTLSGTSQQRMFVALPLGKDPPLAPVLTLGQAAPLPATNSLLHGSKGIEPFSVPSRACCLPFPQCCLP